MYLFNIKAYFCQKAAFYLEFILLQQAMGVLISTSCSWQLHIFLIIFFVGLAYLLNKVILRLGPASWQDHICQTCFKGKRYYNLKYLLCGLNTRGRWWQSQNSSAVPPSHPGASALASDTAAASGKEHLLEQTQPGAHRRHRQPQQAGSRAGSLREPDVRRRDRERTTLWG